jgi:hypothetical protein
MRTKEPAGADTSAERIAIITAKYDSQRHQNAMRSVHPKDHAAAKVERSCKLAPAVLRRRIQPKPA